MAVPETLTPRLARAQARRLDCAAARRQSTALNAAVGAGRLADAAVKGAISAERTAIDIATRLRAERDAAVATARAATAECGDLRGENARLHAGYADALDRVAHLMIERDALTAQNAALRARLGRGGADA